MEGLELVFLRLRAGLYQYQLAQLLGVPATIISNLERGRQPITPEIAEQITKAIKRARNGPVADGCIHQTRAVLKDMGDG